MFPPSLAQMNESAITCLKGKLIDSSYKDQLNYLLFELEGAVTDLKENATSTDFGDVAMQIGTQLRSTECRLAAQLLLEVSQLEFDDSLPEWKKLADEAAQINKFRSGLFRGSLSPISMNKPNERLPQGLDAFFDQLSSYSTTLKNMAQEERDKR